MLGYQGPIIRMPFSTRPITVLFEGGDNFCFRLRTEMVQCLSVNRLC